MTKHDKIEVSRRGFLVGTVAAGTLTMGYALMGGPLGISEARAAGTFSPNIWFDIDSDGIVTVNILKAEMGQHVGTPLSQAVAEELEVPWENVRIRYPDLHGDTAGQYGFIVTGGSWSVNWTFDQLSRAGAAGRIALMEGAVKIWGVPLAELTAENGMVMHAKSGRKISYGDLVKGGVTARNFSADELAALTLKDPSKRKIVGKSVGALDIPAKTNGTATFAIDVSVDGMVVGTPKIPPVRWGAKVTGVDDSEAKKVPGYEGHVVIEDPINTTSGWVVVVADNYHNATLARDALKVSYDLGANVNISSESILAEAAELQKSGTGAQLFVKDGDTGPAIDGAEIKHEATYTTQLNIHAPLEPLNTTVEVKDDVWHVHTGNQLQTLALGHLQAALQVDPSQIVLHQYHLGGGFGRRLETDYVLTAAYTARAMGKPVKMIYSREVDMQMDLFRTITHQVVRGGMSGGKMVGMEHSLVSAWANARLAPAFLADSADKAGKLDPFSINGADHWYTIPNQTITTTMSPQGQAATPSGNLRSVAPAWTFWAVESYLDEMARKAGVDPLDFKLGMLDASGKNAGGPPNSVGGAKRLANVLKMCADKAGYGKAMGDGRAIGLSAVSSQERNSPTWTACAADVSVDKASGEFTIHKLTLVMDVGTAVNPDGVRAQIEGSALWGISLATKEMATMKDGGIVEDNFDTYTPLRMEDMPELDIHIVSDGHYPAGCGEPGVTVTAPAIANAIAAASGARVRDLPITPEKVKAAMA